MYTPAGPPSPRSGHYSLAPANALHRHRSEPHFPKPVLFTNYQFYVTEFEEYARAMLRDPDSGYTSFRLYQATSRFRTATRRCSVSQKHRRCRPIT